MSNYVIDFYDNTTDIQINDFFQTHNCTVLTTYSNLNKVYLVSCPSTPPSTEIVEGIRSDDQTNSLALLDVVVVPQIQTVDTVIDISAERNWWKSYSVDNIDLDQVEHDIKIYGTDSTVYLVDSGIKQDHPEFVGRQVSTLYSINDNFNDNRGHGTALASIIVGTTCGLSNANLKVVKIFEQNQVTLLSQLLAAFDAIIGDIIDNNVVYPIVNLSWAIAKNTYIEEKIRLLINMGVRVVAAAGNNGSPIEDVTPASMPEVLTVGAYNQSFMPCDFSAYTDPTVTSLTGGSTNHGALDCWAPGEKIYVATLDGGYGYTAGTSMACAIMSCSLAYNAARLIYEQITFLDQTKTPYKAILRSGLLDLSDPRYHASVNKIATFFPVDPKKHLSNPPIRYLALRESLGDLSRRDILFSMETTASYEVLDPLPEGCSIQGNRIVYSHSGGPYNLENNYSFNIVRVKINNVDGTEDTIDVYLIKMANNYQTSDIIPDDQVYINLLGPVGPDCTLTTVPVVDCRPSDCSGASLCVVRPNPPGPKGCTCSTTGGD